MFGDSWWKLLMFSKKLPYHVSILRYSCNSNVTCELFTYLENILWTFEIWAYPNRSNTGCAPWYWMVCGLHNIAGILRAFTLPSDAVGSALDYFIFFVLDFFPRLSWLLIFFFHLLELELSSAPKENLSRIHFTLKIQKEWKRQQLRMKISGQYEGEFVVLS